MNINTNAIPKDVQILLDKGAKAYADSEATTNLGRVGRFFARFIKPSTAIKIFAHIITKKS